jgi:hypothetical protein
MNNEREARIKDIAESKSYTDIKCDKITRGFDANVKNINLWFDKLETN